VLGRPKSALSGSYVVNAAEQRVDTPLKSLTSTYRATISATVDLFRQSLKHRLDGQRELSRFSGAAIFLALL
jgi:hypothetical protein